MWKGTDLVEPGTVLGEPAVFVIVAGEELLGDLSRRERRLLVGALNFHALMTPGGQFLAHLYEGGANDLPRTTDDTTFTGRSRSFRRRVATLTVSSIVPPEADEGAPASDNGSADVRHLLIPRDHVLEHDPPRDVPGTPMRRLLKCARTRAPLLYDEARDLELVRHRASYRRRAVRRAYLREFDQGGQHEGLKVALAPPAPQNSLRAAIFGVHWFELGGAERWALESVKIAREAGLLPIILSNRDSHQPWLERIELDGSIVIPFSEPTVDSQRPGVEEVLRQILRTFDVRGVMIHHNQWLYDRAPWLRLSRPDIPIIDSTHIIEYRGGGFPVSAVNADDYISAHHVISPSLREWMTNVQGIEPAKVVMAPLVGLTTDSVAQDVRAREEGEPFTVAFVGRMARQKAPEVFVAIADDLRQHIDPGQMRFIMHGDGELGEWVDSLISRRRLHGSIERRSSALPVSETLAQAHLLVVPSHNEGLTLTTLEALACGVPVVSTNVGAQADVIPAGALVHRNVHLAVRQLSRLVHDLSRDEKRRRKLWREEVSAARRLREAEAADQWLRMEMSTW